MEMLVVEYKTVLSLQVGWLCHLYFADSSQGLSDAELPDFDNTHNIH